MYTHTNNEVWRETKIILLQEQTMSRNKWSFPILQSNQENHEHQKYFWNDMVLQEKAYQA